MNNNWPYATKPTRWILFLRTFLPWQAWRFVWINAKMIAIIARGHARHAPVTKSATSHLES